MVIVPQLYSSTLPMRIIKYFFLVTLGSLLLASCSTVKKYTQTTTTVNALNFLGEFVIPYNLQYGNTTVGGLSGIDYDAKQDLYYLISDDRSDKNPARFYTAKIYLKPTGIDSIQFTGVNSLLQPNGLEYPNYKKDPFNTPDPEAIRYNPISRQLVWTSEGERRIKDKDTILVNPSVNIITSNGKYNSNYQLPYNLYMQTVEKGPRQNGVLEGMSFADNYQTLFVNVEEPLFEDGPRADITDNNSPIRIVKFDVVTKKSMAQYAYKLDPVAFPSTPANGFKVNGVPDILSIGNNKLLVIERSFSTGRLACTIKVFIADLTGATDITDRQLNGTGNYSTVTKKLLLNMDQLGIYIDNIEGVTFGPLLPNGHKTLLFVADNNFAIAEKAQLLLFEVIE